MHFVAVHETLVGAERKCGSARFRQLFEAFRKTYVVVRLSQAVFHLLGVSPRDRSDAIAEAAEEAVGSGRLAERSALAAQQTLMAARMRLDAEVGWLPGVAPARASMPVVLLMKRSVAEKGARIGVE